MQPLSQDEIFNNNTEYTDGNYREGRKSEGAECKQDVIRKMSDVLSVHNWL